MAKNGKKSQSQGRLKSSHTFNSDGSRVLDRGEYSKCGARRCLYVLMFVWVCVCVETCSISIDGLYLSRLFYSIDGHCIAQECARYFLLPYRVFSSIQMVVTSTILKCDAGVWKKYKYCLNCNLIMVERAKWSNNFDDVKYCSDKCRKQAKSGKITPGEASDQKTSDETSN